MEQQKIISINELTILDNVLQTLSKLIENNQDFNTSIYNLKSDKEWSEREKVILNLVYEGLDKKYNYKDLEIVKNSIFQLRSIYIQRDIISKHINITCMIDYKDNFNLTSCLFKKLNDIKISNIQIRNFCIQCHNERDSIINESTNCPYYNSIDLEAKCKCPRDTAYSFCSKCFYIKTSSQLNCILSNITENQNSYSCLVRCNSCGLWICPFYIERVLINNIPNSSLITTKRQDRVCSLCQNPGHTKVTCPLNRPREVKQ